MIDYMSQDTYKDLKAWQTHFVFTKEKDMGSQNQNQFWRTVLEKALNMLYDKAELYEKWLRKKGGGGSTNYEIMIILKAMLWKPIKAFFTHPVTIKCLRQIKNNPIPHSKSNSRIDEPKLPFLFIIDEAAFLYQMNYMHTFMWVLDQPVVHILKELFLQKYDSHGISQQPTDRFFVLMLGTHSQISHFIPNQIFPSQRWVNKPQLLASPFLSFNWDENVEEHKVPFKLRDSEHLSSLASWGRSMWGAILENRKDPRDLKTLIDFAMVKLKPGRDETFQNQLSKLAVLSVRLHLDLDCAAPSHASQLVCSKMRWLVDVGIFRTHVTTTYGSEPILVEAAACLMNSHDEAKITPPFKEYIGELWSQLTKGYISRGNHGELTARILRMFLAKVYLTFSNLVERYSDSPHVEF